MKQKLFIFIFLVFLVAILVGLNAATYTQKEKTPDSEALPRRSTFNSGATGLQAFYTLLSETGRKTVRWQEPPAALLTERSKPSVFVVAGQVRREFTPAEADDLLRWVSSGGRLVLIDREPPADLMRMSGAWTIDVEAKPGYEIMSVDPSDTKQMTGDTPAAKPVQPSHFTSGVNAVQPSQFASAITFERHGYDKAAPPPRSMSSKSDPYVAVDEAAPAVHIAQAQDNLLVDMPYGSGRIVILSDPFIVANDGIALVDNAQLAVNLVSVDGVVAFDEYHQGYGADSNRFLQFFAGTPVVAIFLQAVLLIGLVFFSQSRRFARAVPEPEPDRLSKLEYVAAMAELQQRTRAFDLAIENIYTDFRRRVSRLLGLDNLTVKVRELSAAIADRSGLDRQRTEDILFKCEEIIRGEPTNKREVVELTTALREIEAKLGIRRAVDKKV
ncbi:MAG TPA: DUF4350 domain-containing protein [Pyrinomonadaceae bacterium]|nr:DUF4350 domain-containing protein [Pyrinomonadaceae bacterium]